MSSGNNPDIDPANNGSLAGAIQFAFKKMMQASVNGMLPAQVIAYDRQANRVQVKFMITVLTTDGNQVPRPQIASIPALILGSGTMMINLNIQPGDFGWVQASDRDISIFLQSFAQSPPNTARMFSFADGLFIPHKMTGYTLSNDDLNNDVLSSMDGNRKIVFTPTGINVVVKQGVNASTIEVSPAAINTTVTNGAITTTVQISTAGAITVVTNSVSPWPFNFTGNLRVVGNIGATGTITPGVL